MVVRAGSRGTVVTVTSSTGPPDAAGSRPIAVSMRSRGSLSRSVELSERTGPTRFVSTVRFQPNGCRCAVAYSESALKSAASTSAIAPTSITRPADMGRAPAVEW